MLVTLNGEVTHINESAQRLLNATNLISVNNNQLILPNKYSKTLFDECIAMEYAMRADDSANNTSQFKLLQIVSRESNNTLYAYYSLLLPQRVQGAFGLRPLVMLLFYHPESAPKVDSTILTAAFGLTPSECRTAILLAEGLSQKEISKKLGVQHDTVRKQLQNIYQKTSTTQQSELIRLMLHLPSNFMEERNTI